MKIIVRALIRWSWLLVLCLLVGWFGGKALASGLPPTYQSTALVQLNAQSRTSSVVQPVGAYATLVTSDSVLGTALQKYHNLDRQALAKQLIVATDNATQTISIQVTLPNAREAAGLANDVGQLLVTQENAYIQSLYNKQLQILDGRIADEQKTIDQLNHQIIQLSATPAAATANATAIQQVQSQVNQNQNLETQDITSRQQLLTDQALYNAPLSLVQLATPASKPSTILGLIPIAPLLLIILLILGGTAIFFLEQRAGRINGVYSILKRMALPVLGTLRWTKPSPQTVALRTFCESKTAYAEDCRVMMADVLFHAEEAQATVIAITGVKPRSGCSTIAAELAALLAQSRRRVLLIDANLYEPSLHKRLGVPNEAGLSGMLEEVRAMKAGTTALVNQAPIEMNNRRQFSSIETLRVVGDSGQGAYGNRKSGFSASMQGPHGVSDQKIVEIAGRFPFDKYIQSTSIPNLYMIPAGKPVSNPNSLLSVPEMNQFLQWAAKPADFVIIDSPSLDRAESHVLGSLSDQTLIVVDATRDRMKKVLNTKEELLSTGVKMSGIIINKFGRWV